jgi:hypothetical protein
MPPTAAAPATGVQAAAGGLVLRRPGVPFIAGGVSLALIGWIASQTPDALGLAFSTTGLQNVGQVLTPVALMSVFIERASEVVITTWRSDEMQRRQHALETAQGDSKTFAQHALDFYRLETQRLAFVVSFSLAVIAALVGLRVVQPLLDPTVFASLQKVPAYHLQLLWLSRLDIVLTGLLMAGGADGIHKIITTFTAFLDATRDRAAGSGSAPMPAMQAPMSAAPVQQQPQAADAAQ